MLKLMQLNIFVKTDLKKMQHSLNRKLKRTAFILNIVDAFTVTFDQLNAC